MKIIYTFLAILIGTPVYCQQKQYTIEEATLGLYTNLAQEDLRQLQWIPGEQAFSHLVSTPYGEALVRRKIPALSTDTLLRLDSLGQQIFGRAAFRLFPDVKWLNDSSFYMDIENHFFKATKQATGWKTRPWLTLPEDAGHTKPDPAGNQFAYTRGNNLFLLDSAGKTHQVTHDADAGILNGQSVHREEFGIDGGIFFSPAGNYLAFYRMDQRMVENYPIVNWDETPATVHYAKYPFAGRTSHQVTVGVYNPKTEKTVFLQTGEPKDQYLTCVTWSPDEAYIYIALLNRDQNHLWLNKYNARSGALVKTLFEETDPKYVQPLHPLYFLPGKKGDQFLYWSQRDGFMHLYRYDTTGKLLNQVTKGEWVVNDILGENEKKKIIYLSSSKESPLEKHLYAVNWENGKMTRLDEHPGTHNGVINKEGTYVLDSWTNDTTPNRVELYSADKKRKETLLASKNPLAGYLRPHIEQVHLKADDGTPLDGKIIYPTHFDPKRKYPVIVYLYNGPNVQLLSNSFPASGNLWYEYMAQHGYIVFTMDGRGSSNRGLKFEQATFRHLGTVELEDQMKGVDYLRSLPYVDTARMGIHGWSFGGFMTTSFMLKKPGVFACAVAGGPVMDWKMYEVMYTERYMDTPQDNPNGYEEANLISKAGNLKGKLLLIHGTSDSTVVWQHSINFLKAAIAAKVQVDYFVYPGHEHNVRGYDRVHLMQKISDYFDLYLKPKND